jgi:hypothetical protein
MGSVAEGAGGRMPARRMLSRAAKRRQPDPQASGGGTRRTARPG